MCSQLYGVGAYVHPTLCDSMDCSPPGSSFNGIIPATVLEWVADLLQGIFLTHGSNPCPLHLLHWQTDSFFATVPPGRWRGEWQPTPVFLPGESHGERNPVVTVHEVTKCQTRLSD